MHVVAKQQLPKTEPSSLREKRVEGWLGGSNMRHTKLTSASRTCLFPRVPDYGVDPVARRPSPVAIVCPQFIHRNEAN